MHVQLFLFPALLFLLLLGAAAAVMLFSRTGRKMLIGIGVVVLLLVMGIISFHVGTPTSSYPTDAWRYDILEERAEMPSVWQGDIEREFRTGVYTSAQAAAYGLGEVIADKHKLCLADPNIKTIVICETMDFAVLEAFRDGLKKTISDKEIVIQPKQNGVPQNDRVWILLSKKVSNQQQYSTMGSRVNVKDAQVGSMEATLQTARDKYREQTAFDARRWIEDTSDFKVRHPGHWLVVFSDTASDIDDARQKSRQNACDLIAKAVSESASFTGTRPFSMSPGEIDSVGFIADEFTQELQGASGTIWRNALLLNVSPGLIHSLVGSRTPVIHSQKSSWAWTILSLAGMVGLIFLVYLFANTATKGYRSALMGFIAVIAAVVLGLLLVVIA